LLLQEIWRDGLRDGEGDSDITQRKTQLCLRGYKKAIDYVVKHVITDKPR